MHWLWKEDTGLWKLRTGYLRQFKGIEAENVLEVEGARPLQLNGPGFATNRLESFWQPPADSKATIRP
jgi:hypothetical protein